MVDVLVLLTSCLFQTQLHSQGNREERTVETYQALITFQDCSWYSP